MLVKYIDSIKWQSTSNRPLTRYKNYKLIDIIDDQWYVVIDDDGYEYIASADVFEKPSISRKNKLNKIK